MSVEKANYVCEMTAAGAAIGAFVTVYLAGVAYVGLLPTLLVGWLPAFAAALLIARSVRNLMSLFVELDRGAAFAAHAAARPATIQLPSDEGLAAYLRQRRD